MNTREWAIAKGYIRPGVGQSPPQPGEPSHGEWIDKPTLRLDKWAIEENRKRGSAS